MSAAEFPLGRESARMFLAAMEAGGADPGEIKAAIISLYCAGVLRSTDTEGLIAEFGLAHA